MDVCMCLWGIVDGMAGTATATTKISATATATIDTTITTASGNKGKIALAGGALLAAGLIEAIASVPLPAYVMTSSLLASPYF